MGQTPAVPAVDGHWCPWTPCSKPCDDGTGPGVQTRVCECPKPVGGGAPCFGPSSQFCNTQVCCTPTKTSCAPLECGLFPDGCGGTINCGACKGCVPTKTSCIGADCGVLPNGCPGGTITCPPCCVPITCAPTDCGLIFDGCSATIDCGICASPSSPSSPSSPGSAGSPSSPAN